MQRREWEQCTDPGAMLRALAFLPDVFPSAERTTMFRRLRVFTLTAGRPVMDRVAHSVCYAVAEIGWRVAEGVASNEEIAAASEQLRAVMQERREPPDHSSEAVETSALPRLLHVLALLFTDPVGAALELLDPVSFSIPGQAVSLLTVAETRGCRDLLREVFGDRGRSSSHSYWKTRWRTSAVVAIARQMYESQDFDAMPILADALQDAGCEYEDILKHCHSPGPHIRGCWVVDFVLGKA